MFSVQTHLNHCGLYCTGKLWHKYSYVTWLYVKCMYFFTDEWPTELVSIAQFPCALHSYQWITQIKIYCVSLQNILPEMKSLWNNLQPTLGQRNSCRIQIDETASGLAFLSSRMYPPAAFWSNWTNCPRNEILIAGFTVCFGSEASIISTADGWHWPTVTQHAISAQSATWEPISRSNPVTLQDLPSKQGEMSGMNMCSLLYIEHCSRLISVLL